MTLRNVKLVPLSTVAKVLQCSAATLRRNATRWGLSPVWRGRSPLFREDQVNEWLERGGSRGRQRQRAKSARPALRYRNSARRGAARPEAAGGVQ